MMRNWLVPFGLKPKKIEDGPRYATANDRSMAGAIDITLIFLLLARPSERITEKIFAYYHQVPLGYNPAIQDVATFMAALWQVHVPWLISNGIITLFIGALYVTCQMAYATTPGKWLLGLRIVDVNTLQPPARWRYIARFFAYIPSFLPLMLGFFWLSFNKKHRAWHDFMVRTAVINIRPDGWYYAKFKKGLRWLITLPKHPDTPPASPLVEQPVSEPAAEERHQDSTKPVE